MRRAFTIIELLVVLAIIALMGTLLAFTLPGFIDRSRATNGAASVQGWLNYARQRAQAEERPIGLRFHIEKDDSGNDVVTRGSYIEKPDDYTQGTITFSSGAQNPPLDATLSTANPTIAPGDYLELGGVGQVTRIAAVDYPTGKLTFATPPLTRQLDPGETLVIKTYRIMRGPVVSGDEQVKLPPRVVIRMDVYAKYFAQMKAANIAQPFVVTDGADRYFDILFSPQGQLMDVRDLNNNAMVFWVWMERNNATEFDGNPSLIAVTTNTGAVSAYAPTAGNPFANVK